jgi:transcriptional regulator with XRE-family HTH domain
MDRTPPIARRLKQARLKAGLSQRRLGIAAGIDEFTASARINQYERGRHTPGFGTVELLARALNCPAAYFYARDEDLAEVIRLAGQLGASGRRKLARELRKKLGE